jgi:hypothetical protein
MSGVRTSRAVLCVCAGVSPRRPLDTESSVPGRLLPLMSGICELNEQPSRSEDHSHSQSVANGWESRSSVSRSKTSSSLIFSGQCRGFVLVSQTSFLRSFQLRLSHASRACFSDQSIKPSCVRYFRKYWRFFALVFCRRRSLAGNCLKIEIRFWLKYFGTEFSSTCLFIAA